MRFFLNNLKNLIAVEFSASFAAVSEQFTTLELGYDQLNNKTGQELFVAFSNIPENVKILNLSYNLLGKKTAADLALAFSGIPKHIIKLHLENNGFSNLTIVELTFALKGLPENVKEVSFSLSDINQRTNAEIIELGRALPFVMKINVVDARDNPVHNHLINLLRKHIGGWLIEAYRQVSKIKNEQSMLQFPKAIPIAFEVMSSFVGLTPDLTSFIASRKDTKRLMLIDDEQAENEFNDGMQNGF
jgi:hypothetical protein